MVVTLVPVVLLVVLLVGVGESHSAVSKVSV